MARALPVAVVLVVVAGALSARGDNVVPRISYLRPPAIQRFPADVNLPVLPELQQAPSQPAANKSARGAQLRPESRVEIVRYVAGEFARAVKPLPSGRKGFRFKPGEAVDEKALRQAVANNGSAANPGDTVQITHIDFRQNELAVEVNGGGGGRKTRWRDRIQVSVGGVPQVRTNNPNAPPGYQALGATLILDFGRPVPDLTPDELKQHLAAFLDFSKQRSAAVQWVETLPPEFQQAIKERRAMIGMDRDMVVAALGRPDRKVREHDATGRDTEDWIYGHPPSKTTFVKFAGEKVISVREFPH